MDEAAAVLDRQSVRQALSEAFDPVGWPTSGRVPSESIMGVVWPLLTRLLANHWERADASGARLAEVRETVETFLAVRGGGQGAQDLAEAVRQVLDREPLERSEEGTGHA